ncbi:MAG: glycerol-3-phosphate acyltransferase [Anaerolineae bacterium]
MNPTTPFWVAVAFLFGALPLSYWLGRVALHVDIRDYGDGNPGATNVFKAGGGFWGMTAILLDGFKGAIPLWLAMGIGGIAGWDLTAVALAPILGHCYTPFLRFQGGKAITVSFGVWLALTTWLGPITLGLALTFWVLVLKVEAWAITLGMLTLLAVLLVTHAAPPLLGAWLGNFLILVWRHRHEFRRPRSAPPTQA